jgi:uncharacterized protein with GYD domain
MPIFISRGRFTSDAIKGMLAKPENREEAVAKLFQSVGGRLTAWYLTFGHHDWLAIGEFPDAKADIVWTFSLRRPPAVGLRPQPQSLAPPATGEL